MKKQNNNLMKKYWGTMSLLAAMLLLFIVGSFAAYTNFSSVRRVISVKTDDRVLFSSNLLYCEERNTESSSYKDKKITLTGSNNFVVEVYNYNLGDTSTYNNKTITYTLKATVYTGSESVSGYAVKTDTEQSVAFSGTESEGIYTAELTDQELAGSSLSKKRYTFSVPESDKDKMQICVEAIPGDSSYGATSQKKLAAFIITGERILQKTWEGRFLDERTDRTPDDYDGFNYEITGNGQGEVTMTWDSGILKISPWLASQVVNGSTIQFSVGGEGQPSAYQVQFYKADSWNPDIGWEQLLGAVTVTFEIPGS